MALIQTSLIWVAYAVALAILLVIAALFVFIYQDTRERATSASIVCIVTTLCLLATVLLMPVDIALVSSTTDTKWGRKKSWATPDKVENILLTLKVTYYCLYSVDAVLAILVLPFTYFWHEESEDEEGDVPVGKRVWAAFKYTILFLLVVVALCLIGIFVPFIKGISQSKDQKLSYFVKLLSENHGERALIGAIGLLISIGSIIYSLYTAAGLALLPVALIKSAPSISAPSLAEDTASQLEQNRERQRQLEARNEGREGGLDSRDKRELDALIREERTLVRRERLAAEARGDGKSFLVRAWSKTAALFRPIKLIGGILLVFITLLVWTSMLITGIDKIKNSTCGIKCGYVLGHVNIFQPINWMFVKTSKVFPIDYVIFLLLVVLFFASSVVGIATIGIRFLWISLLKIKKGRTSPQALLFATLLLSLILLGINYGLGMMVAPQYTTFGSQTYCDRPARHPGEQPDCTDHTYAIKACSELADNPVAADVCTPSVVSTFLNRVTVNVPFYGAIQFWTQFVFLGIYLVVFVTTLFRTPRLDVRGIDEDLEADEDEGLLASTGRRFNATWQDITGRAKTRERRMGYGTTNGRDE